MIIQLLLKGLLGQTDLCFSLAFSTYQLGEHSKLLYLSEPQFPHLCNRL